MLSDIHSNLEALTAILATLPKHDIVICLGDVVGYGPDPNGVVEEIRKLSPSYSIKGNHDHAVATGNTSGFSQHAAIAVDWTRQTLTDKNLQYISNLPETAFFTTGSLTIAIYHGSPRDPLSEYVFPHSPRLSLKSLIDQAETDILLLGHTHVPFQIKFDLKMIANPGSVGQPRDGDPRASYAVLEVDSGKASFQVFRLEYKIETVAKKILEAGLPPFLAERLYVGV